MNCYFFGTFNPVHLGHIKIARQIKNQFNYENIIFVPTYISCHKDNVIDFNFRFNMLKLAIPKDLGFVSDIEKTIQPPNYTYKTIKKIGKCDFIIGYDEFFNLENWKNNDYLKKMLKFIVIPREKEYAKNEFEKMRDLGYNFCVADVDFIDISSSRVRNMVKNHEKLEDVLNRKVAEYIYEYRVY